MYKICINKINVHKIEETNKNDYLNQAQSIINFQTNDLIATMDNLKSKGAEFFHDQPQPCPVRSLILLKTTNREFQSKNSQSEPITYPLNKMTSNLGHVNK